MPDAVTAVRETVARTDFPRRARLIAAEIAQHAPDLIALQEAARWEVGGGVVEDHLEQLEAALAGYERAAEIEVGRVALPSRDGTLVSLRNRLAILARDTVAIRDSSGGTFAHNLAIETPLGEFPLTRGWVAVDAGEVRVICTHLEVGGGAGGEAQRAQAAEIVAAAAELAEPVVVAGDFNGRPGTPSYNAMLAAGFADPLAGQDAFTCCHAIPLDDPRDGLRRRIDHVFVRGAGPGEAEVVDSFDGIWASDHAGVVVSV